MNIAVERPVVAALRASRDHVMLVHLTKVACRAIMKHMTELTRRRDVSSFIIEGDANAVCVHIKHVLDERSVKGLLALMTTHRVAPGPNCIVSSATVCWSCQNPDDPTDHEEVSSATLGRSLIQAILQDRLTESRRHDLRRQWLW